jgi:hypothetical protein
MKTKIEEAAKKSWEDMHPAKKYHFEDCVKASFIAGAEFMQGEINELEKEYDETFSTLKKSSSYIETLQAQNEIMMEVICRIENATDFYAIQQENKLINDLCNEALKKVDENK